MFVVKRDGRRERISFDKILHRIENLSDGLDGVRCETLAQRVIQGLYDGVKTTELDSLASETAAYLSTTHPDYDRLAARLAVSNLQKETVDDFAALANLLYHYVNPLNGKHSPLLSQETYEIIQQYAGEIQAHLVYERDFQYSYFGFKTLCKSYLLRINGNIVERPQHLLMRVALGIHGTDLENAFRTYDLMSRMVMTHASPTLFNAGTPRPQCSSCFLLQMTADSIDGIYETLGRCARISKNAGGIGLAIHKIRAKESYIAGTNGTSNGIVPMLRVFNNTARYVDQGGGKRKGAFAIYLEPWHADIFDFLDLRKNTGVEEARARDLFYALWVPDLFMRRVKEDGQWSLMCPDQCPGLHKVHSEEFEQLYTRYEREGKASRTIKAQELWTAIVETQMETGTPYMLYKDACNGKSNQQHLGTIQSSNLCTEIIQYTSPDEVAVCNLASIVLKAFVKGGGKDFDHAGLAEVVHQAVVNLNRIIDRNYYPLEEARVSNLRHRPIGLGVQGLADTFILLRYPFDGPEARGLNREIFETIYYAACQASMELAKRDGPYESYPGSPASRGILQWDMWQAPQLSGRWDWAALKADIARWGLRNSLLVAPMPTASTAQIMGNYECFEPIGSNIYVRRTLAGEFPVINQYLVQDLIRLGLWDPDMKNEIVSARGSIQGIDRIPPEIRHLYRTVWEIRQRAIVDMAADRAPFIDQSQSLNIHMAAPTHGKVTSLHFHAWQSGLKTGMYYLRSRPAADPIAFTVDLHDKTSFGNNLTYKNQQQQGVCNVDDPDSCLSCGS